MIRNIRDINISGKRVFIRCDFNVPKDEFGNIVDDRRIVEVIPTIKYCLDRDCSIILASHFERPEAGVYDPKYSLEAVSIRLRNLLNINVIQAKDVVGEDAKKCVANLTKGEIVLLENLRFHEGETTNDINFAKELAQFADIYINDAFGATHRKHASIHALGLEFDVDSRAGGFLLSKEINFFTKVIENPVHPFVAVVGGSKVSGKLQALESLIDKVDKVIIGGGMAFTFLKALGHEIGTSLCEDELVDNAKQIMKKAKAKGVKFYLPVDVVLAPKFDANTLIKYLPIQEIPKDWMGLDIGPASIQLFREALSDAQTIIWNGPMGVYEIPKFAKGSTKMSHMIAGSYATTIVGGGDTADVTSRAGDIDDMSFVSTGGGASLRLIEGKEMPGIDILRITK